MLEIPVELGERRYSISVGHGLTRLLPDVLEGLRGRSLVLVASRRVFALHGRAVERSLRALGPVHVALVPDGERFKSRTTLDSLYDAFLEARLGRDGLVVALGGGVVGDLAGFAAATWMRGVDWVGLPTTLLSMVDSSIGGKVGINHAKAKNLIGAFHQPRAVVIDPAFLATLPVRELRVRGLRDPQVRDPRRPRPVRVDARGPAGPRGLGPGGSRERDRHRLPHQGRGGGAGRARGRPPARAEPRPHDRPRPGGGDRATAASPTARPWAGASSARPGSPGGGACCRRRPTTRSPRRWTTSGRGRGSPTSRTAALVEALGRDKKARKGRVPFVLPTAIGRVAIHDDVTRDEIVRALRVMAGREAMLRSLRHGECSRDDRNGLVVLRHGEWLPGDGFRKRTRSPAPWGVAARYGFACNWRSLRWGDSIPPCPPGYSRPTDRPIRPPGP